MSKKRRKKGCLPFVVLFFIFVALISQFDSESKTAIEVETPVPEFNAEEIDVSYNELQKYYLSLNQNTTYEGSMQKVLIHSE